MSYKMSFVTDAYDQVNRHLSQSMTSSSVALTSPLVEPRADVDADGRRMCDDRPVELPVNVNDDGGMDDVIVEDDVSGPHQSSYATASPFLATSASPYSSSVRRLGQLQVLVRQQIAGGTTTPLDDLHDAGGRSNSSVHGSSSATNSSNYRRDVDCLKLSAASDVDGDVELQVSAVLEISPPRTSSMPDLPRNNGVDVVAAVSQSSSPIHEQSSVDKAMMAGGNDSVRLVFLLTARVFRLVTV